MKNISNTPLLTTSAFEEYGLKKVYIKDESVNPYGTIKDRRNIAIVKEADRLKVDKLVLITSGNNGYSLSKIAQEKSIKVVCIVNRTIDKNILKSLKNVAYQVIELNLDEKILRPEEIVTFAREKDDEVIWDVTNGYEAVYTAIVNEIFKELANPDYLVVPVGSGGIFIGIVQAVERYRKNTKVIGVGTQSTYQSLADKLSTPWTPYSKALKNHTKQKHKIIRLSEKEIKDTFNKYQHIAKVEPSSSVVFAAPQKIRFKEDDCIVFLNSGKSIIEK